MVLLSKCKYSPQIKSAEALPIPQAIYIHSEANGATTMPKSKAELRENRGAADDEPLGGGALVDDEPADVVAPVADVVALAEVVAGLELAVPEAEEVADDEEEDEVVDVEEPFPLA